MNDDVQPTLIQRLRAHWGALSRPVWERYCSLPRRARLALPAVALGLVSVLVASSATPAAVERPAQGGGGAGKPAVAASPPAAINATPTRQPFIVGTITPVPNRGVSGTATPAVSRIGQTVRVGDYALNVLNVVDPAESIYPLVKPTEGNRFVATEVRVTNASNRTLPYSYLHFRIRDSAGTEIRAIASTTLEPAMQAGNLSSGEIITGWVTYMVRQGVTVDMLYYQPPGALGPRGQVALR
jgi:hypothetical protein